MRHSSPCLPPLQANITIINIAQASAPIVNVAEPLVDSEPGAGAPSSGYSKLCCAGSGFICSLHQLHSAALAAWEAAGPLSFLPRDRLRLQPSVWLRGATAR